LFFVEHIIQVRGMTMKLWRTALLVLALTGPVYAQDFTMAARPQTGEAPIITLPEHVIGEVGSFIKVSATTNGGEVRWFSASPGLNVFPAELLRDSRGTVVVAQAAGEYKLVAYTALGSVPSDPAVVMITIGTPTPPTPPVPGPDAPSAELQTLLAPVRTVMVASPDAAKRKVYAGMWLDFAAAFDANSTAMTTGQFKAAVQAFINAAATRANLQGAFPGFTAALDKSFTGRFGNQDGALDKAKALEFVKGLAWACNH
jgi:hypothetical protein